MADDEMARPVIAPLDLRSRTANEKQTAKRAAQILLAGGENFHLPTKQERNALLVGFAMKQRVLYGAAFDLVRCAIPINLTDAAAIADNLERVVVYEIKSTNKAKTRADFSGYFLI